MTYRGHVRNGQVVLDQPSQLPEGAEVDVALVEGAAGEPAIGQKLLKLAGTIDGPEDWARNHDHYIHGTPKRP